MMISRTKESVRKLLDDFSQVQKDFSAASELFPNSESILVNGFWYMTASEIQKIGDDVRFIKENVYVTSPLNDELNVLYAFICKHYEDKDISMFAEPFVPLCSWKGGAYHNLMFMNYADVISQYFSNDELIINKCDEHIMSLVRDFSKDLLVYLPSRLKKLLIFT